MKRALFAATIWTMSLQIAASANPTGVLNQLSRRNVDMLSFGIEKLNRNLSEWRIKTTHHLLEELMIDVKDGFYSGAQFVDQENRIFISAGCVECGLLPTRKNCESIVRSLRSEDSAETFSGKFGFFVSNFEASVGNQLTFDETVELASKFDIQVSIVGSGKALSCHGPLVGSEIEFTK